eukprot:TRINITY_DN4600_c0_g2_i4.p1 TRINITY_DN4600_c0_g2~~TRINITY_DN4600_c0_g2_i4.p1  ORF type:complete len:166 (-),score=26.98 TRINITY_DN4600_c0_g2_i4:376-822(-)
MEQLKQVPTVLLPIVVVELIVEFTEEQFYVGQLVDFLDKVPRWCVGQVAEIDYPRSMMCIYNVGWSDKWNEWVSFDSDRIAEFRTHTTEDTGPPPAGRPKSEHRAMLTGMGFSEGQARRALDMCWNNPILAQRFLLRIRNGKPNQFLA